jgi:hypothetical protein
MRRAEWLDPDVLAVAQMNYMTGLSVPSAVGSPNTMMSRNDVSSADHSGVQLIHRILRESDTPVFINILGSCRDVAIAGKSAPELFAEKCAGVYLNAGSGTVGEVLESNVRRDPLPFAAIFDLPCPIYWMPCFHRMGKTIEETLKVGEFGTYYRFLQGDILPELSPRLRNFFTYMYREGHYEEEDRPSEIHWLQYLLGDGEDEIVHNQSGLPRYMWCTGGFLHLAGKTVDVNGEIVPLEDRSDTALYSFDPIEVDCDDGGNAQWGLSEHGRGRLIFHVRDLERYEPAMGSALKTLLEVLV